MKLRLLLLSLVCAIRAWADPLGEKVEVTPVAGWILSPQSQSAPVPTLRYAPADGRNATVLLSLLPAGRVGVSDALTLREFNRKACTPYLPTADTPAYPRELRLPSGLGFYVSCTDPALAGKPTRPGDYKVATTVSLLLGQDIVIHATILCDDVNSADFTQAMNIVKSAALAKRTAAANG